MGPARFAAAALSALLLASPRASAPAERPAPAPRTFAVVPFYAPERMWLLYSPFVEHLGRATREPWRLAVHPSHEALIDDLCAGKVDVALLGPVPLARANHRCGAVPFLVVLGADGSPTYRSVLLTTDPEVTSTEQLRGREIGFFQGSTAAHVLPVQMLTEAGLPPASYQAAFFESQDRLMTALLAKKVAAAGVKSALFDRFAKEPGLRRLQSSAPLPSFSFAARPSLAPAARERFASALLRLQPRTRRADAEVVKRWDDELRNGFVRPAPAFLPSVLALQEATERVLGHGP